MAKKIEAKVMKENLKKGWTTEEFCKYLGMSTIDFNEALESSFQDRALRDMKSQLIKNEKIRKKCTKSSKNLIIESTLPPISNTTLPTNTKKDKKEEKTLDELKEDFEKIRNQIVSFEIQKQELMSKRHDFYISLASEKDYLSKLLKEISEKEKMINGLISNLSTLEDQISNFSANISSKQEELDKVSKKIDELTKVVIFFYNDGSFEIDRKKDITIIEDDIIKEYVNSFLSKPEFENITLKQMRGLAKLKVILSSLTSKYEITFDNDDLQKAYNSI